jgi:hypothetical protein
MSDLLNRIILATVGWALLMPMACRAQDSPGCTALHSGIFYNYPKNSNDQFIERRDGQFMSETDVNKNDSTQWHVEWKNDCTYKLSYVSGGASLSRETLTALKKHTVVNEIIRIGDDYYVYQSYLDKTSGLLLETDTMWFHPKLVFGNNPLFKSVQSDAVFKMEHFGDSSAYAVLYFYRPAKLMEKFLTYPVYIGDDILLCMAVDKKGNIFRILKEGQIRLSSRKYKDNPSLSLDVKFGQRYYVKTMVVEGMVWGANHFRTTMVIVPPDIGNAEFSKIAVQYCSCQNQADTLKIPAVPSPSSPNNTK